MKTILVDAVDGLVIKDENGFGIFKEMRDLLETFSNRKIVVTGADNEQHETFGLDAVPYEVFTLKHNPEKTDPEYFRTLLRRFDMAKDDVVYFEHNLEAVESAGSIGIKSYHYDPRERDLEALKAFLIANI